MKFIKLTSRHIKVKDQDLKYKSPLKDIKQEVTEYKNKLQELLLDKNNFLIQENEIILNQDEILLIAPNSQLEECPLPNMQISQEIDLGTRIYLIPLLEANSNISRRGYIVVSESIDEIYTLVSNQL